MKIGVGEFKARCLGLIEEVHQQGGEILLTKRGRALARVVPWEAPSRPFPFPPGTVEIVGEWR